METGDLEEIEQISEDEQKYNSNELDTEIQLIPVQLIQSSSNVSVGVSPRGKYYKQTYRPAWEHMPDFRGWLRGVEGEPRRAFCIYCHKTLHAHRLSLLKHTCTIRHQKAAQVHNSRKNKLKEETNEEAVGNEEDEREALSNEGDNEQEMYNEEELEDEEREEDVQQTSDNTNDKNVQQKGVTDKPPITTQVTDTTKGKPISGLQVSLYKLIDGRWTFVNEGSTDSSGKFNQFINRNDFTTGRYKLHYDVDRYFESKRMETIYPFIEVVFDAGVFTETYQMMLLLSPFSYTTFRGS
ncbi:unnamed protein product [Phyllotreta striolata]|uniref:hydroxyisourate hydrolase n=1 Tax=Phyllotreta striolata TaxID=444603 RepID=A0A9N9XNT4_PHYSR|nr:unnamed protein product [Phyllotreta striolata]